MAEILITPVSVQSEMLPFVSTGFVGGIRSLDSTFPGSPSQLEDLTLTGKIGSPSDVANLVSYLASAQSHYITGEFIPLGILKFASL